MSRGKNVVTVQRSLFQEREKRFGEKTSCAELLAGALLGYGPMSIISIKKQIPAAGSLALLMRGYLLINRGFPQFCALQAIVHDRQERHAGEPKQKAQEDATKENDDAHNITSLQSKNSR